MLANNVLLSHGNNYMLALVSTAGTFLTLFNPLNAMYRSSASLLQHPKGIQSLTDVL